LTAKRPEVDLQDGGVMGGSETHHSVGAARRTEGPRRQSSLARSVVGGVVGVKGADTSVLR
jgi:hypothetical protein